MQTYDDDGKILYGVYLKPSQGWHDDCYKIRKETSTEVNKIHIFAEARTQEECHAAWNVARSATAVASRRKTIKDGAGDENVALEVNIGPDDDDGVDLLGEFLAEPGGTEPRSPQTPGSAKESVAASSSMSSSPVGKRRPVKGTRARRKAAKGKKKAKQAKRRQTTPKKPQDPDAQNRGTLPGPTPKRMTTVRRVKEIGLSKQVAVQCKQLLANLERKDGHALVSIKIFEDHLEKLDSRLTEIVVPAYTEGYDPLHPSDESEDGVKLLAELRELHSQFNKAEIVKLIIAVSDTNMGIALWTAAQDYMKLGYTIVVDDYREVALVRELTLAYDVNKDYPLYAALLTKSEGEVASDDPLAEIYVHKLPQARRADFQTKWVVRGFVDFMRLKDNHKLWKPL